jgi:hypothetical protein
VVQGEADGERSRLNAVLTAIVKLRFFTRATKMSLCDRNVEANCEIILFLELDPIGFFDSINNLKCVLLDFFS